VVRAHGAAARMTHGGTTGRSGRLAPRALLGLGLFALAVRLAFLFVGHRAGLFHGLFLDSKVYAETAATLRLGHGAGAHPYLLSPLYPYFLALFPGIEAEPTTNAAILVRAVQAAFGAGTCVLTAVIAQAVAGRRAAWLAGIAAALFGPLVHFDAAILVACLQGFCLTLAVALAVVPSGTRGRTGAWRWLAAGVALGVSAALRPTTLAVACALAMLLLFDLFARRRRGERGGAWSIVPLLLGVTLVVTPFAIRNARVSGERILLSANGGLNFWAGNHGAHDEGLLRGIAAPGVFTPPPGYDLYRDPLALELVSRALERPVSHAEASAWWRDRALADVRAAPLAWLALLARKALLFLHPVEIPQLGASYEWYRERAWPLRFPLDSRWVLILALAAPFALRVTGGRAAARRARVPLLALIVYGAAVCLFFVTGRYRAPIMPIALALAAASVVELARGLRAGATQRVRALALLAAIVALGAGSRLLYGAGGPLEIRGSTGIEERHVGMSLVEQGRYEEAIEVYRAALAERDDARTRANLARALRAAGRIEAAYDEYRRVLDERPGDAVSLYELGNLVWEEWKRPAEAEALFRRATAAAPRFAEAHFNLGAVLVQQRRFQEAAPVLQTALQLASPSAPWRAEAERAHAIALRGGGPRPERD